MFTIEGKVGIVTGGASGIGLACVKHFLKNGMRGVTIADINEKLAAQVLKELIKEYGEDKVLFVKVDVSNKNEFNDAFKKTIEKFNNIDVLVNNAGISNEKDWEKMVAVNVNGQIIGNVLGFETYIPKYKSSSLGVIINICSIASFVVRGFNPIYSATKHANLGLSRSFGIKEHFERTKVKVISVCPGRTETAIADNPDLLILNENYAKLLECCNHRVKQSPSHVGASIVNLIENADTGSVWVIAKNEEPYEIEIVTRHQIVKKSN
ncbi:hypothetical protein FQR65_LT07702 [Abscondita terminalis]|nr:hypothetical protein FQR65_LT07702 [Abscondita terminalis]